MSNPTLDLWQGSNRDLGGASHLQLLLACVAATTGSVLEIGIGHSSTPVLHSICCPNRRRLVSLESDPDWRRNFMPWAVDGHELYDDTEEKLVELALEGAQKRWGVVFVDDSPGGEPRAAHLRRFLPIADYVVMHDAEPEGNNFALAEEETRGCPYRVFYKRYHPHTLAASMFNPIPHVP
jgi:hypothetical protein